MPNTFTAPQAAQVAASLVQKDGFLSALVSRNYTEQFLAPGRANAPVQVKIPTTLIARTRQIADTTNPIVLDTIAEQTKTFNLDKEMDYSAVPLSEFDLSLALTDFAAQVLRPQAESIVDYHEHKVATALQDVDLTSSIAYDPADPVKFFTRLRKHLRDNGVSAEGLTVLVGTGIYADLLDAKAITDVSESGSTDALRNGNVGKVRSFTVAESNRVEEDEILAFHRDAVTLITRAPAAPQGASFAANVNEKGTSLRYIRDYDAMNTVDRSILATFSGVGILPTYKVERDYATRTVKVTELENGGVVHAAYDRTAGAMEEEGAGA